MAATPYKPVSWPVGSPTDVARLSQMASNDQYLFENMPKMTYSSAGLKRAAGVKVLSGKALYTAQTVDWAVVDISFGNYFSPGCQPVVVCTVASYWSHRKYVTVCGFDGTEIIDHRGFKATVASYEGTVRGNAAWSVLNPGGHINWIALGY